MTIAHLDFSLRIAGPGDLADVARLRADAYGHHLPGMATALATPDPTDTAPGTTVLVCRDKASGEVIGTARIQRNHPRPLPIEGSLVLPAELAALPRAEITRLAIAPGASSLVRPMLVKACYLAAVASQVRLLVIGARSPALVRIYRGLGFEPVGSDARPVPLAHAGNLPHHVLSFDVVGAERRWHAGRHPLYTFMVETWHPDLQLLAEPMPEPAAPRPVRTAAATRRWRQPVSRPVAFAGLAASHRPAVRA
ncbi:MAG: hypothetical protein JNM26_13065 [Ideonella sp.]|nr:hypothetical protein [Ideonella sp.]